MTQPKTLIVAAALAFSIAAPSTVHAFEPFALLVPCRVTAENSVGTTRPCITCHDNADGGMGCPAPPCWNAFGTAFDANGRVWNTALALLDSDGDGYTNGEELGDPMGVWRAGMSTPGTCDCATRPGFMSFTPGDTDGDMDGYCCLGRDMDGNGDCLGGSERDGSFDCDDMDPLASSGATEICGNPADNDCDGFTTLLDPDCTMVVDRDGDGFCPIGRDVNGDRDCLDTGEDDGSIDCDDDQPTVSPAAGENCVDGLDNDCDMLIDLADPECTSDSDGDMDGYCPLGRDINMDGDCNDAGELSAGFDCDDGQATVNSGATELCTDLLDNDCDGLSDFRDEVDCGAFFDSDGDGYCPAGRDVNMNGNCVDAGEDAEPGDCDDTDPAINPGMLEACLDTDVDEDCDMLISLADPDCATHIDTDGDGFCFVGADMNMDGTCVDLDEQSGRGDCDELSVAVRPTAIEDCTDGIDNDCDGSVDGAQRVTCDAYRDIDGDGWCFEGQDMDGDGFCDDPGEQGTLSEWTADMDPHSPPGSQGTEDWPTRYPGAPEHCWNMIDEDLDGMIDEAGYCRQDVDADGDGHCPIGTDLNGDGDCLDMDENTRTTDCNDMDATVNPGEMERCTEPVDADCDGDFGTSDEDCFRLLDRDGDAICGVGIDDNGDGDCLDDGEDRFGVDCDDRDPAVNSRAREVCNDGIDNDCDDTIDYYDSQCECESPDVCDDGDPCTMDVCNSDQSCENPPDSTCGDGGPMMGDGGMTGGDDGCGCRVNSDASPAPLGLLLLGLLVAIVRRRRSL